MNRRCFRGFTVALTMIVVASFAIALNNVLAQVPFELVEQTQFNPDPDYSGNTDWARVGDRFLLTNNSYGEHINAYDLEFNLVEVITPIVSVGEIRGICYDPNHDRLFLANGGGAGWLIYEMDWNGIIYNSFHCMSDYHGQQALTYDQATDHIYVLNYYGTIIELPREGVLVRSIDINFPSGEWTGMSIDWNNNTFLLTGAWVPPPGDAVDKVYEYTLDGELIATVIDEDGVYMNGFGIYYDSAEERLYYSNTDEDIWIWQRTDVTSTPEVASPIAFAIDGNWPNPFNPMTTVGYRLVEPGTMRLAVHDAAGRPVRVLYEGWQGVGEHTAVWDGRNAAGRPLASGVYFACLTVNGEMTEHKLTLLK